MLSLVRLQVLKDRFEAFVPALSRWGGTTVGLSLIAIGGMGLLELWQEHREQQQPEPALEGETAMRILICFRLIRGMLIRGVDIQ